MNERQVHKIPVAFRVWPGSGVLALFPTIEWSRQGSQVFCQSYEHVGQHGGADYAGCVKRTRAAEPSEYAELQAELEAIGYKLGII